MIVNSMIRMMIKMIKCDKCKFLIENKTSNIKLECIKYEQQLKFIHINILKNCPYYSERNKKK
jgi:hypothetical protein